MEKKIGSHSKWMVLLLIIAVAVTIPPVSATTHVVELGQAWIWDRPSVTSGLVNLCQSDPYTIQINAGDFVELRMEYAFTDERTQSGDNWVTFFMRNLGTDLARDEICDWSSTDDGEHRYLSWSNRYYSDATLSISLYAGYSGDRNWQEYEQIQVNVDVV